MSPLSEASLVWLTSDKSDPRNISLSELSSYPTWQAQQCHGRGKYSWKILETRTTTQHSLESPRHGAQLYGDLQRLCNSHVAINDVKLDKLWQLSTFSTFSDSWPLTFVSESDSMKQVSTFQGLSAGHANVCEKTYFITTIGGPVLTNCGVKEASVLNLSMRHDRKFISFSKLFQTYR